MKMVKVKIPQRDCWSSTCRVTPKIGWSKTTISWLLMEATQTIISRKVNYSVSVDAGSLHITHNKGSNGARIGLVQMLSKCIGFYMLVQHHVLITTHPLSSLINACWECKCSSSKNCTWCSWRLARSAHHIIFYNITMSRMMLYKILSLAQTKSTLISTFLWKASRHHAAISMSVVGSCFMGTRLTCTCTCRHAWCEFSSNIPDQNSLYFLPCELFAFYTHGPLYFRLMIIFTTDDWHLSILRMVGFGASLEIATVISYTTGTKPRRFCTADTNPCMSGNT